MRKELLETVRTPSNEESFRHRNAALLARLRAEEERHAARAELAARSRITDDVLLDQLVAFGITPDTLIALSLLPLVEVAWADGTVEQAEQRAILAAARAEGLEEGSGGYRLLRMCLSERPRTELRKLWEQYILCLCATLSAEQRDTLEAELLQQAHHVAEAAGELMGPGSRVCKREKALLAEIAATFRKAAD